MTKEEIMNNNAKMLSDIAKISVEDAMTMLLAVTEEIDLSLDDLDGAIDKFKLITNITSTEGKYLIETYNGFKN